VQVHVLARALAPGVQHAGHAELSTQSLGIMAKRIERAPGGPEQGPVDHLGMGLHPGVEPMGQREHQVEVGHRQLVGALALTPGLGGPSLALGTLAVAAAAVARLLGPAAIAAPLQAAQRLGAKADQMSAHAFLLRDEPLGVEARKMPVQFFIFVTPAGRIRPDSRFLQFPKILFIIKIVRYKFRPPRKRNVVP